MSPTQDDPPRWEIVPNQPQRCPTEPYVPPATDRLDPVTVVGHPSPVGMMAKFVVLGASMSAATFNMSDHSLTWGLVAAGVMAATVGVGWIAVRRHRPAHRPRVVVTAEGLSVCDITGERYEVSWVDFGAPSLTQPGGRARTQVVLAWTEPTTRRTMAVLGDTVDLQEVRNAIIAHAPASVRLDAVGSTGDPPGTD